MATTYPTTKQTFTNPIGTNTLDSPDHAGQHADINDTVEALQDTVGTTLGTNVLFNFAAGEFPVRNTGGGATGTLVQTLVGGTRSAGVSNNMTYGTPAISGGTWTNPAMIGTGQITGGTHSGGVLANNTIGTPNISAGTWLNAGLIGTSQITGGTVNNATIGTPTIILGSDATGDLFFRSAGGTVTRLAAGTLNHVLTSGGIGTAPSWAAAAASGGGTDWNTSSGTWTCTGFDVGGKTGTITVNADVTGVLSKGMKVKFTQGGSTLMGYISKAPTVATGTTTFTYFGGTFVGSTTAITNPFYSWSKLPYGFPSASDDWTVSITDTTQHNQTPPTQNTWYNIGTLKLDIPIGDWFISRKAVVYSDRGTAGVISHFTTLSTGTANETDGVFTLQYTTAPTTSQSFTHTGEMPLTLTSKTTYYHNVKTDTTGVSYLYLQNNNTTFYIKARCAFYL